MEKLEMPKADEIRFETVKNGEYTNITYYVNEKKKLSFGAVLYPELLDKIISRIQRFLSTALDMSFETISMKNGEDAYEIHMVPTDMAVFQGAYGEVDEPWMGLEFHYPNKKTGKQSKTYASGTKKQLLGALYNMVLQIDSSKKNEEIESLLESNLFAYYDITADADWEENVYVPMNTVFGLKILDVKEVETGSAYVTVEDGCGNTFTFVDEEFQKHKKAHKIGSRVKYKVEFKVTTIEENRFAKDIVKDDDVVYFREETLFSDFPEYEFAGVAFNIESDGKNDYSFIMNMMNNSDKENVRPIHVEILHPSETNLEEGETVSGKGYFVASKYYAEDFYEYGKYYSDEEYEDDDELDYFKDELTKALGK